MLAYGVWEWALVLELGVDDCSECGGWGGWWLMEA